MQADLTYMRKEYSTLSSMHDTQNDGIRAVERRLEDFLRGMREDIQLLSDQMGNLVKRQEILEDTVQSLEQEGLSDVSGSLRELPNRRVLADSVASGPPGLTKSAGQKEAKMWQSLTLMQPSVVHTQTEQSALFILKPIQSFPLDLVDRLDQVEVHQEGWRTPIGRESSWYPRPAE